MRKIALAAIAASALSGGAVYAADLPAYTKAPPPVIAPVFSWTGFYVGANAGYTWGDTDVVYTPPGGPDGFIPVDVATYGAGATRGIRTDGFTGGGQIGYNYQINQFVLGIEADVGYLERRGGFVGTFPMVWGVQNVNITGKDGWVATVRGRAGFAFDRFMVYATGGVAFTDAGVHIGNNWNPAIDVRDASTTISNTKTGWVVGGGFEYAFAPSWSLKLEYLHMEFDRTTVIVNTPGMLNTAATVPHRYDVDFSDNIVRVGINYRFGAPGAPLVAKY